MEIVVVTGEHPTEISAKHIGFAVGEALEQKGHKVTLAKMPPEYSLFVKVAENKKGKLSDKELAKERGETSRFAFLRHVCENFPNALVLAFHNSPPNEAKRFKEDTGRRITNHDRKLAKHEPVTYQPFSGINRIVAVEIPAIFKRMPKKWQSKVSKAASKSGIKASRQLMTVVDMKATRQAGLLGEEMASKVLCLVQKRIYSLKARQKPKPKKKQKPKMLRKPR
jgi:hypothetical protein